MIDLCPRLVEDMTGKRITVNLIANPAAGFLSDTLIVDPIRDHYRADIGIAVRCRWLALCNIATEAIGLRRISALDS